MSKVAASPPAYIYRHGGSFDDIPLAVAGRDHHARIRRPFMLGAQAVFASPEQFTDFVRGDVAKRKKVIAAARIKPEGN